MFLLDELNVIYLTNAKQTWTDLSINISYEVMRCC